MPVPDSLVKILQDLEANYKSLPLATKPEDIVPGEGLVTAKIMLIGEAPGRHEAEARRPFVGRSGKFLRQTLFDIGLDPKILFISNIVKVRPPENRDPSPAEILAYQPYLDREIAVIKPEMIITLGRFSLVKFLPDVKISQVHGKLHLITWQERSIQILPMYHPAAGLRNGKVKKAFIQDFKNTVILHA